MKEFVLVNKCQSKDQVVSAIKITSKNEYEIRKFSKKVKWCHIWGMNYIQTAGTFFVLDKYAFFNIYKSLKMKLV